LDDEEEAVGPPMAFTGVEVGDHGGLVGEAAGAALEHATSSVEQKGKQSLKVHVHVAAPSESDWYEKCMGLPHKVEQSSRVHDCPSAVPDISNTASTTSAL
jgi:hypothetical protein